MTCTTVQKFGVSIYFMLTELHLFAQSYSKNSDIVKYYYNSKQLISI